MKTPPHVVHQPLNNQVLIAIVGGYLHVDPVEIIRFVADDNLVKILLIGSESILKAPKTLDEVCERFAEDDFIRINKSCAINMKHMRIFLREDSGTIELSDGTTEYLSDIYRKPFMDWLKRKAEDS